MDPDNESHPRHHEFRAVVKPERARAEGDQDRPEGYRGPVDATRPGLGIIGRWPGLVRRITANHTTANATIPSHRTRSAVSPGSDPELIKMNTRPAMAAIPAPMRSPDIPRVCHECHTAPADTLIHKTTGTATIALVG